MECLYINASSVTSFLAKPTVCSTAAMWFFTEAIYLGIPFLNVTLLLGWLFANDFLTNAATLG